MDTLMVYLLILGDMCIFSDHKNAILLKYVENLDFFLMSNLCK